jgi:hypothetical protein
MRRERRHPSISIEFGADRGRRGRQPGGSGQAFALPEVNLGAAQSGDQAVDLGFGGDLVGAGGAHFVLGLTVLAKDLARGSVGAATESTLPVHSACWCTAPIRSSRFVDGYEAVEQLQTKRKS